MPIRRPDRIPLLAVAFLVATTGLAAQDASSAPSPADLAARCTVEEARTFDFWVGTWDVSTAQGPAGVNEIESILGGCVLLENWTGNGGGSGKSFNWIDRSSFREPTWRQLWVDATGNTLDYHRGRLEEGAMVFEGHTFSPEGDSIPQRLTFEPVHPDTVRQIFEQSSDGGTTWTATWIGTYVRRR